MTDTAHWLPRVSEGLHTPLQVSQNSLSRQLEFVVQAGVVVVRMLEAVAVVRAAFVVCGGGGGGGGGCVVGFGWQEH